MFLYSTHQTHMLERPKFKGVRQILMAYTWLDFVMFHYILSLNLPYKDESAFNIHSFNSANRHFC